MRGVTEQYRFGPLFYLAAFLLAFVWVPGTLLTCLFLAIFFAFTGESGGGEAMEGERDRVKGGSR